MRPLQSKGVPIHPSSTALIGGATTPWDAGMTPINAMTRSGQPLGFAINGMRGNRGMRGMRACGCGPTTGCGCTPGLEGLRATSLDQIINNTFSWLSGVVQSNLPNSAAVPPQYGSAGSVATQVQDWLPYIIGGYLLYRLVK